MIRRPSASSEGRCWLRPIARWIWCRPLRSTLSRVISQQLLDKPPRANSRTPHPARTWKDLSERSRDRRVSIAARHVPDSGRTPCHFRGAGELLTTTGSSTSTAPVSVPFKNFFSDALVCAKAWYQHFCPGFPPDTVLPQIFLATCHDPDPNPVFAHGEFFVYGLTQFLDRGPTIAMLAFRTAGFGWECFNACPYVLFHECIAHAFQDILPAAARREPNKYDAFAEGWMDWVALQVLHDRVAGRAPRNLELRASPLSADASVAAERYHHERARWHQSDAPSTAPTADVGRRGASYVKHILTTLTDDLDEGWAEFLKLSFGLNVQSDLANRRDALARKASDLSRQQGCTEDLDLRNRLSLFLETGDPSCVVQ